MEPPGCCSVLAESRLEAVTRELEEREALMNQQLKTSEADGATQLSVAQVRN